MAVAARAAPVAPGPVVRPLQSAVARPSALHVVGSLVVTLAVALFTSGFAWEVQWYIWVGRDRVLTLPHVVLLFGIALAGLTSLAPVLAAAPPAIPPWLGWAIGLVPTWALLWFARAQARRIGAPQPRLARGARHA